MNKRSTVSIDDLKNVEAILTRSSFKHVSCEQDSNGGIHVTANLKLVTIILHKASEQCGFIIFKLYIKNGKNIGRLSLPYIYDRQEAFGKWLYARLIDAHTVNVSELYLALDRYNENKSVYIIE
ncbi:hypothetical protein L4D09_22135 [Photobacterium makurazakiensis]|uniref:hypothetical protein n=1 Tax=Photobacterium makurazakiensis TaxID=2910234 RepID=UPI003D0976F2